MHFFIKWIKSITLAYGMHYLKELNDNPRLVTFVDFGHSQTTIIYAEFTRTLFKILSVTSERLLNIHIYNNKF